MTSMNRLADMDPFTAAELADIRRVVHEFNNQLCVVVSYSELLKDRLSNPNAPLYAANISTAAQKASELLTQLLSMTCAQALNDPTPEVPASTFSFKLPKNLRILAIEDEEVLLCML